MMSRMTLTSGAGEHKTRYHSYRLRLTVDITECSSRLGSPVYVSI